MSDKKILIICTSVHHGNTLKVAQAMGAVLHAQILKPSEVDIENLSQYDAIGFGSGIYDGKNHKNLLEFVSKIKTQDNKKVFIFSTATFPFLIMHKDLREGLVAKGFEIIGEFQCKGFIDYSIMKYFFGGINKGRPNEEDLKKAQDFAKSLCV